MNKEREWQDGKAPTTRTKKKTDQDYSTKVKPAQEQSLVDMKLAIIRILHRYR